MTDELRNILERFNPDEPYVWRLRIGDETYQLLEAYIAEKSASMSKDITESDARLVIITWRNGTGAYTKVRKRDRPMLPMI